MNTDTTILEETQSGEVFNSAKLSPALLYIEDILQRALVPFQVVGKAGLDLYNNLGLEADGVDIAILRNDLPLEASKTLTAYLDNEFSNDFDKYTKSFTFDYSGVPVRVKVIEGDYDFFKNPDFRFWMATQYKIPNPFMSYWEKREEIA